MKTPNQTLDYLRPRIAAATRGIRIMILWDKIRGAGGYSYRWWIAAQHAAQSAILDKLWAKLKKASPNDPDGVLQVVATCPDDTAAEVIFKRLVGIDTTKPLPLAWAQFLRTIRIIHQHTQYHETENNPPA